MGISAAVSTVTIYQNVFSTMFTEKTFSVTDASQKTYALGHLSVVGNDVVIINGLYQVRGEAYKVESDETQSYIVFLPDTVLTVGDDIQVYFEKQFVEEI